MNDRYRLNSEWIRSWLEREGRKQSYLSRSLGVSDRLVDSMLTGHIPKERTLNRLAALLGIEVSTLLIPAEAKETA